MGNMHCGDMSESEKQGDEEVGAYINNMSNSWAAPHHLGVAALLPLCCVPMGLLAALSMLSAMSGLVPLLVDDQGPIKLAWLW